MKPGKAAGNAHGATSYDRIYAKTEKYRRPYRRSHYFPMWQILLQWLRHTVKRPKVLEPGCGPGQLAAFLHASGFKRYYGFDFSPVAIQMARKMAPGQRFAVADIRSQESFDVYDYNTVIMTEVLEHIDDDLAIFAKLKPGARVLLSVPDNDTRTHVRYFPVIADVVERYQPFLGKMAIRTHGHWHVATGVTK